MVLKSKLLRILLISAAVIFTLIGLIALIMVFAFDSIFLTILAKNLALLPSSPVYPDWLKPSVPIYFSINLFNITNTEAVYAGAKPHLQVVGPFVYRETRERYNVNFSENVSPRTVRFNHRIFYHFVPEKSIGDPNKYTIFTPDLYSLFIYPTGFGWFANKAFISLTAQEVMWGYEKFYQTIGMFSTINGTLVNEFVMNIGTEDIQNLGQIYEVNGEKKTDMWNNAEANMINGTDGSLFPPGLKIGSTVEIYAPEICRTVALYAVDKKTTLNHDKIEVLVFTGSPPNPDDPLAKWRSDMFCDDAFRGCPPKGLLGLQTCLAVKESSVPMYISQPYFLSADPEIAASFDGLPVPDPYKHSTWVHIEPTAIADKGKLDMLYNQLLSLREFFPFLFIIVAAVSIVLAVILIIVLVVCARTRDTPYMSKDDGLVSPSNMYEIESPKQYTNFDEKAMSMTTIPWSRSGGDGAYRTQPKEDITMNEKSRSTSTRFHVNPVGYPD